MRGRYGDLGTVVDDEPSGEKEGELVVRGGVSRALIYHLPRGQVVDISDDHRTVTADVDVADFVPSLRDDGTVVLQLPY